ncbi:MAG: pyrrolo-quinoline quinone [Rhodospirillaceae bacterium]|nr:pyrrolo-quinoline quinone [Rhodospirillaceae bacterium]
MPVTRIICRLFFLIISVILTSGCSLGFLGEKEQKTRIAGDRVSISSLDKELQIDDSLKDTRVSTPYPKVNKRWLQPGGNSSHSMQHLSFGDAPEIIWQVDIGAGSSGNTVLMASPVVYDSHIFTLDVSGKVRASDIKDGSLIWEFSANQQEKDSVFGGAISAGNGNVFISLGSGHLICLDVNNGREIWRTSSGSPLRSPASYSDDRLFVITIDNRTIAFSAQNGQRLWLHNGISEKAALLGAASPAIKNNTVILAYSSGELYAMKAETGSVFWGDNLGKTRRTAAVTNIADIRGSPVIDGGVVLAASHSGRLTALNFQTGRRLWERSIGSTSMPWVAGDFVYLISTNGEVICLTRSDGRIKWLTQMQKFKSPKDKEDTISYVGPVLAGDRLLLASSLGKIYSISPYTGKVLGETKLGGGFYIAPVVANKMLFLLDDKGVLTAFR